MEVQITNLDHQGRGIGRINNKIIFIPNTIPGEIVNIKITNEKKKYMEGIVTDFIETSSERIFNLCPYYPYLKTIVYIIITYARARVNR